MHQVPDGVKVVVRGTSGKDDMSGGDQTTLDGSTGIPATLVDDVGGGCNALTLYDMVTLLSKALNAA